MCIKYCGAKCKITGEFHETVSDHSYFFIPVILFSHFKILASVSSKLSELTAAAAVESAVIQTVGRGETVRGYRVAVSGGVDERVGVTLEETRIHKFNILL